MDGFYTHAVQAFYSGGDEWTALRVGIGVDTVQMSGTVDMQDYPGPFFEMFGLLALQRSGVRVMEIDVAEQSLSRDVEERADG